MQIQLKLTFSLFFAILMVGSAMAQTDIEEALLEGQEDVAVSELLEQLEFYRSHPLDLNDADLTTLQSFPLISPVLAREIAQERLQNGSFQSWSDFQERINLDQDFIAQIKSCFKVTSQKPKIEPILNLRWRHQREFPLSRGYDDHIYPGSVWKGYQRLRVNYQERIQGCLLLEKDPGERTWNDHIVGYIETDQCPMIRRLLVGHYRLEAGQGLVLWGPYGYSKGDPIASIKSRARGAVGYGYSDENQYLRGIAIEINTISSVQLTIFASRSSLDATIGENENIRNFSVSGLHRTSSELTHRKVLEERLTGAVISCQWSFGTIGIAGWQNQYSRTIDAEDHIRYRFAFQGRRNHVLGIHYDLYWNHTNISGECAQSQSGGLACIANSMVDFKELALVLSYRYFSPDFQNPHGIGCSNDDGANDEGIYFGFRSRLTRNTRLNLYYDIYRKLWRTYFVPVPTRGNDFYSQIEHRFSSKSNIYIRARFRSGEGMDEGNTFNGRDVELLRTRLHSLFRCELKLHPAARLRLRNRLEMVRVNYPEIKGDISSASHLETGFLGFQDIQFSIHSHLTLAVRWTTFDTDSYDSRIYMFESDLPGVLSIRPVFGKGTRMAVLLQWHLYPSLRISAKFSSTYHDGFESWGSGYDAIQGDTETQIGFQVDWRI